MKWLLGKSVIFMPTCFEDKAGASLKEFAHPVKGTVTMIHSKHGWFMVSFKAGKTVQRECFKFYDLQRTVMLCGRKKDVQQKDCLQ